MKRKRQQLEEPINHNVNNNNNETKKLKYAAEDNSSIVHDESEIDTTTDEKRDEFVLTREIAENAVLSDIAGKKWKIGAPIGKGSFGEIFLASDVITRSVSVKNAHYVTKIEPHSNGPLFVEIHCLLNVNKQNGELPQNSSLNRNLIIFFF